MAAWSGRYVSDPPRFETFRYVDRLFDTVKVSADDGALLWQPVGGAAQRLEPAGGYLFRAPDRELASHVLLTERGVRTISVGTRSWRQLGVMEFAGTWLSLVLGVGGLLVLWILVPWRAWRRGRR